MKKETISNIVNIWDPLGVLGLAPNDEYDDIVNFIYEHYKQEKINQDELYNFLLNQTINKNEIDKIKINALINLLNIINHSS